MQKTEKKNIENRLERIMKEEEQAKTRKHGIEEYQRLHDSIKQEEKEMISQLDAEIDALQMQEGEIIKQKNTLKEKKKDMQRRTQKLLQKCNDNMKKAAEENTILQGYIKERTPAKAETPKMPSQLAAESKEKGDPTELTLLFQNLTDAISMIAGCLLDDTQREKTAAATEGLRLIIKAAGGHGTITRTDTPSTEGLAEDSSSKKTKIGEMEQTPSGDVKSQ